jgi:hypothetical protein
MYTSLLNLTGLMNLKVQNVNQIYATVLSFLKFSDRDGRIVGNSIPAPKIEGLPPAGTINLVFCSLDLYESQATVDAQSGKLTQFSEFVSEQVVAKSAMSAEPDMVEEPWTGSDYLRPIADLVSIQLSCQVISPEFWMPPLCTVGNDVPGF